MMGAIIINLIGVGQKNMMMVDSSMPQGEHKKLRNSKIEIEI